MKEFRTYGPPGVGKTTWLARQVENAAAKFGSNSVFLSSFTRSAAAELVSRNLPVPPHAVGTLHAHCFRAIGSPEIAESHAKEFNDAYPHFAVTPSGTASMDEGTADQPTGERPGDELAAQYQILRNRMTPRSVWPLNVLAFARAWERWKGEAGYMDFTDLIEFALEHTEHAEGNPAVGFIDEAQDLTPLQLALVRKWGQAMEYFILVGDDDQASLPGALVRTVTGDVPVEKLDPAYDRLCCYDNAHSYVRNSGFAFSIKPSHYSGEACRVRAGGRQTETTHNHPWLVKWTGTAMGKHVVYLMKRGASFRVGWCKVLRSDGCNHIRHRARLEGADALWVLRVCDSKEEASIWESYVAATFGLTTCLFTEVKNGTAQLYSQNGLDWLFAKLGDHTARAAQCLEHFGRDMRYPFINMLKAAHKGGKVTFEVKSCNLLPGLMMVPVHEGKKSKRAPWQTITDVERFYYEGTVYGLNVEPHHTYVADGMVTHNCIYGFTGASPDAFLGTEIPSENKIVLNQSYRIPRVVQAAAVQWIKRVARREDKPYAPRDFEGELLFAPSGNFQQPKPLVEYVKRYIEAGKTIMFLAACSYQLAKLIKTLREEGIPYHNPFRKTRGDWNPLAPRKGTSTVDRLIAYLEPDSPDPGIWSPTQLAQWLEMCTAKGLLKRGAKQLLKGTLPQCPASDANLDEWEVYYKWLDNLFEPGALQGGGWQQEPAWLTAHANATFSPKLDFPMSILGKGGIEALRATPRVVVGTIHSVKGGQADVTVLCPDISLSSYQAASKSQQARDETIRQFYVGMTRCRETLIICKPATQWHVRGLA